MSNRGVGLLDLHLLIPSIHELTFTTSKLAAHLWAFLLEGERITQRLCCWTFHEALSTTRLLEATLVAWSFNKTWLFGKNLVSKAWCLLTFLLQLITSEQRVYPVQNQRTLSWQGVIRAHSFLQLWGMITSPVLPHCLLILELLLALNADTRVAADFGRIFCHRFNWLISLILI